MADYPHMRRSGTKRHLVLSAMATALALGTGLAVLASPTGPGHPIPEPAGTAAEAHDGISSVPAVTGEGAAAEGAADAELQILHRTLTSILSQGAGRAGDWGILAVSTARGDTLFALDHDRPLTPASNQKLFTSAGALHHLGAEFRFPTFLLSDGEIAGGVLQGNLILYGTGDPAMSDRLLESESEPFRSFARTLRGLGVHTIRGDVLGDGTFFTGPMRRDSWNPRDLNDWFAAPVSGLSFNENLVTLQIRAGRPGQAPRVLTQPEGAELLLVNRGRTVAGGVGTPLMVGRDDPSDPIELTGQMQVGQPDAWRRLTVSDPPAFAASVLRWVLEDEGIQVLGRSRSVSSPAASAVTGRQLVAPGFSPVQAGSPREPSVWTVDIHRSPPLHELLEVVNRRSHNLYAEALLLAMGRIGEGEGSFDAGSRVLTRYLTDVAGLDPEGFHVEDGSGLSRLNRARASSFIQLMAHLEDQPMGPVFWASLPEAGNRRELRRMYRSPAAGNLRAKTGTIHRVSALSGVVRTREGEGVFFSIMANNVSSPWAAKQVEDRIGIQLASFSRPLLGPDHPDLPRPGLPDHTGNVVADQEQ